VSPVRAWVTLGLMSGTSMDGIDACLARIRLTETSFEFDIIDTAAIPFENDLRQAIGRCMAGTVEEVARLHFQLGAAYADAARSFLEGRQVDLVGCHGQTVAHRDGRFTLQVGTPAYLAIRLQAPVVANFREADIAAGGNGAPLMPFLDWLLCRSQNKPAATLNLGGVANITAIPPGGARDDAAGFDTGPGMGLIDEAAQLLFDQPYDQDGRFSRAGVVDERVLEELMAHPFVHRRPPKSTGRDEFGRELVADLTEKFTISPEDLLRTLVRYTATSIAFNLREFVKFYTSLDTLVASGGGVCHPLLMSDLETVLPGWKVLTSETLGIHPDFKEALLMAVLAVAHVHKIPGNMPGVTGAGKAVVLGQLSSC